MIDAILALIAPHHCYGCGESGSILCLSCYNDITEEEFGRCVWCLKPASVTDQCRACTSRHGVTGVWTVGERTGILKSLVGDYKYESIRESAKVMAKLLDQRIAVLPKNTIVTAVPTVRQHIRTRGFDHAAMLAREFSGLRQLRFTPLLSRRHQRSQHDLKLAARHRAAREAFGLKNTPESGPVLLIDDIMTTGATIEACVQLLREAGVQDIYVAVIARQLLDETPPPLVK